MTHKLGNGCEQSKKTDEFVDGIEEMYKKRERIKALVLFYSLKLLRLDLPVAAFSLLLVDTKEESCPLPWGPLAE